MMAAARPPAAPAPMPDVPTDADGYPTPEGVRVLREALARITAAMPGERVTLSAVELSDPHGLTAAQLHERRRAQTAGEIDNEAMRAEAARQRRMVELRMEAGDG